MNECRVSVRDVRGSAPGRRSDASLTHCRPRTPRCAPRCALRAEMCRDSPHVLEIRPACRDLRRVPEIRVAKTPSDDEPSHIFSLSSLEIPSFFGTLMRYIYILHLTPLCTSAGVILDSGTFSDISDVLAFAKFEMCIFFYIDGTKAVV